MAEPQGVKNAKFSLRPQSWRLFPEEHCSPLACLGRLSTLAPAVPGQGDRLRVMAGWSDLGGWAAIGFAGPPPRPC